MQEHRKKYIALCSQGNLTQYLTFDISFVFYSSSSHLSFFCNSDWILAKETFFKKKCKVENKAVDYEKGPFHLRR